ncbi:MAG: hypothetical protein ACYCT1_08375 [Steroidobacteraceae bacterium]
MRLSGETLDVLWGGAASVAAGAGKNVIDTHEAARTALVAAGTASPTVQQIAQAEAAALKIKVTAYQWGYAGGLFVGGLALSAVAGRSRTLQRVANGLTMSGAYDLGNYGTHTLRGKMQPAAAAGSGGGARALGARGNGARADLSAGIQDAGNRFTPPPGLRRLSSQPAEAA